MQEITPEELGERLQDGDGDPLVLDIRYEAEFEEWHIPGSLDVDVYDGSTEGLEQAKGALSEHPRDEQIVTSCAAGAVVSLSSPSALMSSQPGLTEAIPWMPPLGIVH